MNKKRTLKESEELIKKLQTKCWEQDKLLCKMRMALYYVKKFLGQIDDELDGMWCHDFDGSSLLVSKDELFDIIQNKIRRDKIKHGIDVINKPLSELKNFIGW